MDIPSPADAVPSLTGILKTGGGVKVSKDKDVVINANMEIMKSILTVQKFEPGFVFEIYQNILSDTFTTHFTFISTRRDFRLLSHFRGASSKAARRLLLITKDF